MVMTLPGTNGGAVRVAEAVRTLSLSPWVPWAV